MKKREAKGAPSADLLVCFPSRAHLSLMPKPICSPARSSEPNKRHHNHHLLHLRKSNTRNGSHGSPLLWAKSKQMGSEMVSEPTSPKVTCAGQIKVRHKARACKSWQSVMEEIERLHNDRKQQKKKPNWAESLGFKKDIMQFLTCLRNIRFDFRCFGNFHESDITSDDEEDEEQEEVRGLEAGEGTEASRTVFSKWFMVLQEEQSNEICREENKEIRDVKQTVGEGSDGSGAPAIPPPNALLLMRCRSAPAKTWLEEKAEEENNKKDEDEDEEVEEEKKISKSLRCLMDDEKRKTKDNLVVMRYDPDFYKISSDIAKETWVVGGIRDPFSRSRSWKR
ncbi:hypothetical protein UlMin_035231 [Ulmus minor]